MVSPPPVVPYPNPAQGAAHEPIWLVHRGPLARLVDATSLALLAGTLAWAATDGTLLRRSAFSLLVAYLWTVSIGVGALVWVALGHLIGARWQVALRRLAELLTSPLPRLTLIGGMLLLAVVQGAPIVYPWIDAGAHAPELAARARYLSPWSFALRGAAYLTLWNLLARYFVSHSLAQDRTRTAELVPRLRRASAPALIALLLTLTFAAIDWVMSLDPSFVSAIFGLYFTIGCLVGALASLALLAAVAVRSRDLREVLNSRHFHDLGRSLFTLVLLWSYLAFCQFLLLWYTNLPFEAPWLARRLSGSWAGVTWLLAGVHCLVPLVGMLPRRAKEPRQLAFWGAWLLCAHYLDLYWLVMPELAPTAPPVHPLDFVFLVGALGTAVGAVLRAVGRAKLAPVGDPRLALPSRLDQA